MARPTVINKSVIDKLEQAFALGCTDLEATLLANIAPATLYNYQERHPMFLERKEQLKSSPILKARQAVIKSFSANPNLALKYLERKKKDEFSIRIDSDITSSGRPLPQPLMGGRSLGKHLLEVELVSSS